ncbi:MAG: divalent-cation tolerance protein CutA [Candidatus Marinimicrobia bacterium]|nr:divalent-cation tolerance protein CutA [Candidatus Neomarinimicrobiota bacterium]
MDFAFIITTVSTEKEGRMIANELVKNKLAACVNIVPKVYSVYEWDNAIQNETEVMLMIKTTKAREKEIYQTVQSLHSYDTPELITLPIENGSDTYLRWVENSVQEIGIE